MAIKNYTSSVPVERTIARIEQVLAKAGATGISKDYVSGVLTSLSFKVTLPNGRDVSIRLPANHNAVYQTLRNKVIKPRSGTIEKIHDQSMRTSWKLMQDWVEVQISLIEMQQVDFMQVFLPYVWDGKRTFYAAIKESNYAGLLTAPRKENQT